jgi:hypothetical protein
VHCLLFPTDTTRWTAPPSANYGYLPKGQHVLGMKCGQQRRRETMTSL